MAARVAAHLGAIGLALALHERDPFRRIPVRMNVDDAHARGRALRARVTRACQQCGGGTGQKSTPRRHRYPPLERYVMRNPVSVSSPRKRGPIFQSRWLWVPALAGTTVT